MAGKIEEGKSLKRLIRVYGVEGWVEVTLSHEGLAMRIPKTRKSLTAPWTKIVEGAMATPDDSPSFLMGEPLKFLQAEAAKVTKKAVKKAGEKA